MRRILSHLVLVVAVGVNFAQAFVIHSCDYFNSSVCESEGTNNAMMNYGSCHFSACGGQDVVISNYQNCIGDTFLRLYDINGSELSYISDVYWDYENLDNCSEISFSLPKSADCYDYESRVGCSENGDCSAAVTINVSDANSEYVRDAMRHPEGESWTQACPAFNLTGSSGHYDPSQTAMCSFELCPGEYYTAYVKDCTHDTRVDLFSYSDVQYTNYNLACEDNVGEDEVAKLYFDTIGHDSCRLFSFYAFCDSHDSTEWCSGSIELTKKTFPVVNITWTGSALSAQPEDILQFSMSNMTVDYDYWNYGEVSFWVVVYKTDMLEHQEHCGYRDYTRGDFYDYVGYFEWFAVGGNFTVTNYNGTGDYTVGTHGGNHTAVLFAWADSYRAVSVIATSEVLTVAGTSAVQMVVQKHQVDKGTGDQLVQVAWSVKGEECVEGDVVVVVPVDHKGFCSPHDAEDIDSYIHHEEVCLPGSSPSQGTVRMTISHCSDLTHSDLVYEVQYRRGHEVLGRVTADNVTVFSEQTEEGNIGESPMDALIGHVLIGVSVVAAVSFSLAYYVRSRGQRAQSYDGLNCFSLHDGEDDGVVMLNMQGGESGSDKQWKYNDVVA